MKLNNLRLRAAAAWATTAILVTRAGAIEPPRQPHQPLGGGSKLLTFNETVKTPSFAASSLSVSWVGGGEDGQYIYQADSKALILENLVTGASSTIVAADKIPKNVQEYWIRPDYKKVLFATNYTKQYRHSYFADYSVLDVASGELTPLVADQKGDIQYAEFAPKGDAIVFVRGNNLYLSRNGAITQVTKDGGPDMFHGVPDWVYEEEVFGDRKSLWFSPDGQVLAFLSFDETGVETFTVPYYTDNTGIAPSYPRELHLRYPKVGTKNPTVSLSLLYVETGELRPVTVDAYPPEDLIIGEVAWTTTNHSSVVYRALNRVQDRSKHVRVDVRDTASSRTPPSAVIRDRDGSDGWLDNHIVIQYIGAIKGLPGTWYLDLSDESGWEHIYLFPVEGGDKIALTSGEWEVTSMLKVDTARQLVYYLSTEHHSTERHLYSVNFVTKEKKALVDDTVAAYWSASFSSGGSYYILSYQGPDVPYQELYAINSTKAIRTIRSNEALWTKLQGYNLPNITYLELRRPDGFSLNVMQRLPPKFNPSKKYPALFIPYGGPGAQEVHKRFSALNWKAYIASDPELEFITYTVDGRGTGYRGRKFRSTVAKQLGKLETEDQIWAARELSKENAFIDAGKIGIFGWSYGGYLSAKVVEADSGVFSLGLIVAPVTDWRLYDSIYTERYQKTSQANPGGYNTTAVRRLEGFRNIAGGFTVLHGLGDDNVHYQNSAQLVDSLVRAGIPPSKFEWRSFTDSDHSINYHGATAYLYKHLTSLLYKEKLRTGPELTHQWSKKRAVEEIVARKHRS